MDTLAEWLRRRPAKPMGSPRVGSNPTGVDFSKVATFAVISLKCASGGISRSMGCGEKGLFRELNPGPLAPEARIMPLDQTAK